MNNTSIQYHLGLSIETIGSGIGSDPIRVDGYDYSGDNTYTGVRLEITENNVPSIPLYLGYIAYNDDTHKWEFIANSGAIYKFIGNTVQIDLDKSLNLTEFNYSGSLQGWLENYIVIDDGEI